MKVYEKIITILITLALLLCLYFTGQSVYRTAVRCTARFTHHTASCKAGSLKPAAITGICKDKLSPVIHPIGKQQAFYPFPGAVRQISSCILFFLLYAQTVYV
ncbi:MAG: hypothetical protein HFH02_00190 [Dorea sp.]|nr:hypothetical protein [Dorea sp.]